VSLSKRILFGNDPADEGARQQLREETARYLDGFKFKIPTRRRNRLGVGPHWDPFWPSSVMAAAKELNVVTVQINDQVCTRTQAHSDAVRVRAQAIHQTKVEHFLSLRR
jgi:hypothetical protein